MVNGINLIPMLLLATSVQSLPQIIEGDTQRFPPMTVTGDALNEESPTGPYNQPLWTRARRFPTTRVYLQREPWEVGVEQWWRGRFFRDRSVGHLLQEEVELGLPYRFQADVYEDWTIGSKGHIAHQDVSTELRWALADWGVIPLNPTLYGEWKFTDPDRGPDVYELKLLLGEELASGWHWGFNAIFEQEVGGDRTREFAFSQGVSYSVIDQKLGVGVEMKFSHETIKGSRAHPEMGFLLGPSIQFSPWKRAHLDVVPLAGLTHDAPALEAYVVLSIDLWAGPERSRYAPASLRSQ